MAQLKIDAQPDTICSTIFFDLSCIVFHIESSQRILSRAMAQNYQSVGWWWRGATARGVETAAPEDGCRSKVSRRWDWPDARVTIIARPRAWDRRRKVRGLVPFSAAFCAFGADQWERWNCLL